MIAKEKDCVRREEKLYQRKEKLCTESNYRRRDTRDMQEHSVEEMEDKKEFAMLTILPRDTQELKDLYLDYGYHLNSTLSSAQEALLSSYSELRWHAVDMARNQAEIAADLSQRWRSVESRFSEELSKADLLESVGNVERPGVELVVNWQ